ncbi:MAG: hypothetical protein SNH27_16100 [Rikenellaceae bacterium]
MAKVETNIEGNHNEVENIGCTPDVFNAVLKALNTKDQQVDRVLAIIEKKDEHIDRLLNLLEKDKIEIPEQTEAISQVETSQEELDGYNIIRNILRNCVDVSRIQYIDYQSYFVVNLDGSWRWLCRLYLKAQSVKYISFPKESGAGEDKFKIENIDDIFNFTEQLEKSLNNHLETK